MNGSGNTNVNTMLNQIESGNISVPCFKYLDAPSNLKNTVIFQKAAIQKIELTAQYVINSMFLKGPICTEFPSKRVLTHEFQLNYAVI